MTQQRILVLDGSPAGDAACGLAACVARDGTGRLSVVALCQQAGRSAAEGISLLAEQALAQAGWTHANRPDCVAVVVGPGSFTGLRASCAVAAGYALGAGAALVGVTRGEAMAPMLAAAVAAHGSALRGWQLVTAARRGRVFVEGAEGVQAVSIADWHPPEGQWLIAGDAAQSLPYVAPVMLSQTQPTPEEIAAAALLRLSGGLPAREALPLYVDPPEASLPADGLRPAPV